MRYQRICRAKWCLGFSLYLVAASSGMLASAQTGVKTYGDDAQPAAHQQNQRQNLNQHQNLNKTSDDYQKHVKDAEREHNRQEKQINNAIFKSNVRHALEHGKASQQH